MGGGGRCVAGESPGLAGPGLERGQELRKCHRVGTQDPQAWFRGSQNLIRACDEGPWNSFLLMFVFQKGNIQLSEVPWKTNIWTSIF